MRSRTRRFQPACPQLEPRCLLSGLPLASWLGQDGHDLAGGASPLAGNGVQDIHIQLSNLPSDHAIRTVNVQGYGGGDWPVNFGSYSVYSGVLQQSAGSTTADVYVDPYQTETGRQFSVTITYDDQSSVQVYFNGGPADANLRIPASAVAAGWYGQDGPDYTGPNVGVGPDGIRDVHLALTQLFGPTAVNAVRVTSSAGQSWEYGSNPGARMNAEFGRSGSDPTRGDLYFSPDRDMAGQNLTVTVFYVDGKTDQTTLVAQPTNPALIAAAANLPTIAWDTFHAVWGGQDGLNLIGPGDAHLALDGLPAGRTVVTAVVSDQAGIDWSYVKPGSGATAADPSARPLGLQVRNDPTRIDLTFPPARNEAGATLTVLLGLDNGTYLATRVTAGATDPGLRAPGIASSVVVAYPGDDLNDLANRYGTVRLVGGFYSMSQPLVLNHPVSILGAAGSTLVFSQASGGPGWTAAIKVIASHTTLDGFAVRFAGPIRWKDNISFGPAVIGTLDNYDAWNPDPRLALTFSHLDLQSPPASSSWEEAVHLIRLANAESGAISGNRLKGGTIEFFNGPWQVTSNTYLGTPTNTFSYTVISTHYTHDVTIANNVIQPTGANSKTWRFLVMTQNGVNDVVRGNQVVGVGPMDSDTVANPNAPEVVLTESYRLHYEGNVAGVSADGRVVQIYSPNGGPARTGDVLAILSGPEAGQWRTIAQAINDTTYLLDSPITPGKFAVSIATGFVNERFDGNRIDARGSSVADDLVIVGNQFGLSVVNNVFLGGNHAFRISAYPTEQPNIWGWSHAPLLGAVIAGNTIQDTLLGGTINVDHSVYVKSDAGRVYFSGSVRDNLGIWTTAFLTARAQIAGLPAPALLTVGDSLSVDPGELVLSATANTVQGPASLLASATFQVVSGTLNGVSVRNAAISLGGSSVQTAVRPTSPSPAPTSPSPTTKPTTISRPPVSKPVVAAPPPRVVPHADAVARAARMAAVLHARWLKLVRASIAARSWAQRHGR